MYCKLYIYGGNRSLCMRDERLHVAIAVQNFQKKMQYFVWFELVMWNVCAIIPFSWHWRQHTNRVERRIVFCVKLKLMPVITFSQRSECEFLKNISLSVSKYCFDGHRWHSWMYTIGIAQSVEVLYFISELHICTSSVRVRVQPGTKYLYGKKNPSECMWFVCRLPVAVV